LSEESEIEFGFKGVLFYFEMGSRLCTLGYMEGLS
jgi:hypothetical protein